LEETIQGLQQNLGKANQSLEDSKKKFFRIGKETMGGKIEKF